MNARMHAPEKEAANGSRMCRERDFARLPAPVQDALRSSGQPLDAGARSLMETQHGHDFSRVRIHTGVQAEASAQAIGAEAYTVGEAVVFGSGAYAPGTRAGRALLEHELAHVVQQSWVPEGARPLMSHRNDPHEQTARTGAAAAYGPVPLIQRQERFGPGTTGVPADWAQRVRAATTSAQRAALIHEAVGIDVVDRTEQCNADTTVDIAHLEAYSFDRPRINYDDNLNQKQSPVDRRRLTGNAGYTRRSGSSYYVVLGPQALQEGDFYETREVLSHEFDHIRQYESGSTLTGNESELDAWTSSFIRDFHRSYVMGVAGQRCYVDRISEYAPLLDYYRRSDVGDSARDNAIRRITAHYRAVIAPHPGHSRVFRFWLHRTLKRRADIADLARRLNTDLGINLDPSLDLRETRQFECADVRAATYPGPPAVDLPSRAAPMGAPQRFGLELRGGASLGEDEKRAAVSLGLRVSLRPDRMVVFNPFIGAQLLYLPPGGNREEHLASAIGEIGLRIQQPLRGFYMDVRTGGAIGVALPSLGPRVEGGFTGAFGFGYRWENIEIGAEARGILNKEGSDRLIIVGAAGFDF
ncbi:MAG: DUF4157 domain-containing protein [Armatimonadetes bacterium]|nr:DUF4157 domain-containing protein [Armatimonadota bacterium]